MHSVRFRHRRLAVVTAAILTLGTFFAAHGRGCHSTRTNGDSAALCAVGRHG
ncbi:hypothetical protein [Fodinicola feengrottensis]|uniref:hypothetical protein n=1 Tax=Fodinicola feengrottensis TaxID=435914 RepID=UPI002440F2F1|nr:hypothetical protein [Fodinicola feengrottensis]